MLTYRQCLMREICTRVGAELRDFTGQTDHAHVLVHYPPSIARSMPTNRLNGVSSRRLPQQNPANARK
jgi:putative transposase